MDLQGILSSVYCGSIMKNFIARAIWLISFPDFAQLGFNCVVQLMLAVSPAATGDNESRVITDSGHFFFTWIYNLLATSLLIFMITVGLSKLEEQWIRTYTSMWSPQVTRSKGKEGQKE